MRQAYVLRADTVLAPVQMLSQATRRQFIHDPDDFLLTLPNSRIASRIVSSSSEQLLREFMVPTPIAEAVLRYSRREQREPEAVLTAAYPLLSKLVEVGLLLKSENVEPAQATRRLPSDAVFAGFRLIRPLQILDDSEVHQVEDEQHVQGVLKLARLSPLRASVAMLHREQVILPYLSANVAPRLIATGEHEGNPFSIIEWLPGVTAAVAAADLRLHRTDESREQLLKLCCTIVETYSRLHAQSVLHGDIHPNNVVVLPGGDVRIIDFGLGQLLQVDSRLDATSNRGGVPYFFEPEYARCCMSRIAPPTSSFAGEQYAVAALLYFLICGDFYLDFSMERDALLRQITEEDPLPFCSRGKVAAWPGMEQVLGQALRKEPAQRFSNMADFAAALRSVPFSNRPSRSLLLSSSSESGGGHSPGQEFLTEVVRHWTQTDVLDRRWPTPSCSITYGAAGAAYALYRLARATENPELLAVADQVCQFALHRANDGGAYYNSAMGITPEVVGRLTFYHCDGGLHVTQALLCHAMGDLVGMERAVKAFCAVSERPCSNLDLTLGQSSVLIACTQLLGVMPSGSLLSLDLLRSLGNRTLQCIWEKVSLYGSIRDGTVLKYFGIAHGWAGILYATLRWCQIARVDIPGPVKLLLDELAEWGQVVGDGLRWPLNIGTTSVPSTINRMAGWCNGSAGMVFLWTAAYAAFGEADYLTFAERAAISTFEAAERTASLCCGCAGQAYALLNLYRYTHESVWLHRGGELAKRAVECLSQTGELPNSLYKGGLGVAVLLVDIRDPAGARFPLFEDEGF